MMTRLFVTFILLASLAPAQAKLPEVARSSPSPVVATEALAVQPTVVQPPTVHQPPTVQQLPSFDQPFEPRAVQDDLNNVAALAAGYAHLAMCMGSAQRGQGIHFRSDALIQDLGLDPAAPELLMLEHRQDGSLWLIAAEYGDVRQARNDAGNVAAPARSDRAVTLNAKLSNEPSYALYLWSWQYEPLGAFADWNPVVQCPSEPGGRMGGP